MEEPRLHAAYQLYERRPMTQEGTQTPPSTGDWVMAGISFLLTLLIPFALLLPLILGVYNLTKGQKSKAKLYFSVIGLLVVASLLRVLL